MAVQPMHMLSVVIPCYNESQTLRACVERVLRMADEILGIQIVIVDDCSTDGSLAVARELASVYPAISVLHHELNRGKGAALRTGFAAATGDFVAVQDADLEYAPSDLRRLCGPLIRGEADVVLGSRFIAAGQHRVLYFWHFMGNRALTFLSNMMTDINLTDMEAGYKVFRREIIRSVRIEENRFGFEPEIVAKVAQLRVRIFEMGISYHGRTFAEGKKIRMKDGWRALYCIIKYSVHTAPWPSQLLFFMAAFCAGGILDIALFDRLYAHGAGALFSVAAAFLLTIPETFLYYLALIPRMGAAGQKGVAATAAGVAALLAALLALDAGITLMLLGRGIDPPAAKSAALLAGFVLAFAARRIPLFELHPFRDWGPQQINTKRPSGQAL